MLLKTISLANLWPPVITWSFLILILCFLLYKRKSINSHNFSVLNYGKDAHHFSVLKHAWFIFYHDRRQLELMESGRISHRSYAYLTYWNMSTVTKRNLHLSLTWIDDSWTIFQQIPISHAPFQALIAQFILTQKTLYFSRRKTLNISLN